MGTEQNIVSSAIVKLPILLYGSVQITKPETGELYAQTDVENPIPNAPTSLVATDAGLGDAVNLNWVSSATYFNVYKKVGIVYTKLNPNVLTTGTSYLAGNLTADVATDFAVRAANGLGQESADSNIAIATPTLDDTATRFTNPVYEIYISGVLKPTAILSSVELGFGSDLSTASFVLPIDPRETAPAVNEPVEVFINGRKIFKGYVSIRNDSIDSSGLQINYVCHSNIIDLMATSFYSTDERGINTIFNVPDTTPETMAILRNSASANDILTKLGVSGGPNAYPGHVDITDQNALAAAELVLSRVGNYKLYHDMNTGATSAYQFGSLGLATRQFQFAKNIVSYKIDESFIDVVKKVTVIGAPTKYRTKYNPAGTMVAKRDPDGRLALSFKISGTNLQDIQVYGWQRAKPTIEFDQDIQVTLADFIDVTENLDANFQQGYEQNFADSAFGWKTAAGEVLNNSKWTDLYPIATSIRHYQKTRVGLGAKIVYSDSDHATVYLSEVPKLWTTVTKKGKVKRATVGAKSALFNGEFLTVEIVQYYDFKTGPVEVEFTVDTPPPVVIVGSGTPSKSITDSQYEVVLNRVGIPLAGWSVAKFGNDPTGGSNNTASVATRMRVRALAELARTSNPSIGGNMTVVGDETIDLRSSVLIKGQLLEISHVSHSFQGGFTTSFTLTNEPFVKNTVFAPVFLGTANTSNTEKFHKSVFEDTRSETYFRLKKELASEKDSTVDKQAASSSKYALYQD